MGLQCDGVKSWIFVVSWGMGTAIFHLSVVDLVGNGAGFPAWWEGVKKGHRSDLTDLIS